MKLVFSGIQWCGKWTQARLLEEKYGVKILDMWGEFRRVVGSGSELWNTLKEILEKWDQVNGELWKQVMEDAIEKVLENHSNEMVVFDGFIRNDWNVEIFNRLLPDYKVVLFELSEEKSKQRLLGRMFNKTTWETFMTGTTHDPETGEELIRRADDNEEGILKRIQLYKDLTLPVVEMQRTEGRVIEVNADQSIEEVFAELQEKLWLSEKKDYC